MDAIFWNCDISVGTGRISKFFLFCIIFNLYFHNLSCSTLFQFVRVWSRFQALVTKTLVHLAANVVTLVSSKLKCFRIVLSGIWKQLPTCLLSCQLDFYKMTGVNWSWFSTDYVFGHFIKPHFLPFCQLYTTAGSRLCLHDLTDENFLSKFGLKCGQ